MRYAHTVEQVRAAETALMDTVPNGTLMQRAATGLATACIELMGQAYGARVLLLVGTGSNGGDALYAGARLARRGAQVEALLLAPEAHDGGLAAFRAAGGRIVDLLADYDLVVDGIVGIGGRPGLRGRAAEVVEAVAAAQMPVVAVDVPSGVDVDTGELPGPHVRADVTVTFGTHKACLLVDPAASAAGSVELIDIGLDAYLGAPMLEVLQADDVGALLPIPDRAAHKYTRGVVGISAGSEQYVGAGLLATSAAVSSGLVGMVRYAGPSADLVRARHPEVVVGVGQVQAWVVGPGMGSEQGKEVARVLAEGVPTVIDADGLRFIPDRFTIPAVLTPHAGELARLLEVDRAEIEGHPLRSATTAAERWNAVVLLKGARSVVASPDGRVRVNATGVPWLATAGAGDVLSGVVGTLLASGLAPFDAASVGAWLHGAAATLASAGGPISASDLLDALPEAARLALA
jgi:hydroxyethylthiazole kinase-like uncharacterized protein yjeF